MDRVQVVDAEMCSDPAAGPVTEAKRSLSDESGARVQVVGAEMCSDPAAEIGRAHV